MSLILPGRPCRKGAAYWRNIFISLRNWSAQRDAYHQHLLQTREAGSLTDQSKCGHENGHATQKLAPYSLRNWFLTTTTEMLSFLASDGNHGAAIFITAASLLAGPRN